MNYDGGIDVACVAADGYLTIDGVVMARRAFAVLDAWRLAEDADERGGDLEIPGRPWPLPGPRNGTTTVKTLRMVVDPRFTVDGSPSLDPAGNWWEVTQFLSTYVSATTWTGDGTRGVTVSLPSGAMRSARAHCSIRYGERAGQLVRAALTLSFPEGVPA